MTRPIIAINYYFGPRELNNRVFSEAYTGGASVILKSFKRYFEQLGVDVLTIDMVDCLDPRVKYVLYFDYNWRLLSSDPYLRKVPKEKRALILIEPSNINPSMYFISFLRDQFKLIFTWNLDLLRKNPSYERINVLLGAEPRHYRHNPFTANSFASKRFLVAINRNRWSYMPQSTYRIRKRAYRYFEKHLPSDFDLFGTGWNQPAIFYEKWFRIPIFSSFRGPIKEGFDEKIKVLSTYKFCLCFENNVSEPGYISEKITDCFCARCVPIYFGSEGVEQLIPKNAWINFRDFSGFNELSRYLASMDEAMHQNYLNGIDNFLLSPQSDYFSTEHFCAALANRLIRNDAYPQR